MQPSVTIMQSTKKETVRLVVHIWTRGRSAGGYLGVRWSIHGSIIQKYYPGPKKERNQWLFVVVKGILGQRYYESDYWPELTR